MLIVELDGPAGDVAGRDRRGRARSAARRAPTRSGPRADAAERARIWKGRKSAFAAVGRISPDYIVQDGVVPRTALPEVLRPDRASCRPRGFRVANVFHAGDGNLHPLVLFDDAVPGEQERAEELSGAILDLCIEHGGSITGEHGVGVDKSRYMPQDVQRRRPRHDAAAAMRLRPGRALQPRQGLPDAPAVRRGARASGTRRIRSWPRAWSSSVLM